MVIGTLCGLLGLIVGSFLNVVILRHGARAVDGRSICMSCGRQLAWYDMVPVFSWVFLRGRCRSCKSRISIQYPLVEAATGVLFAFIGVWAYPLVLYTWHMWPVFIAYFVICALLVAIAVYDFKHTIISDGWAYTFASLAFFSHFLTIDSFPSIAILLVSGPLIALPLFLLWLVSRGTWMGLGDAKLALGIGWLLGPELGLLALLGAFILGALVAVCILMPMPYIARALRITQLGNAQSTFTMKSEVAFGPFLIMSCIVVWLMMLYGIPIPFLYL